MIPNIARIDVPRQRCTIIPIAVPHRTDMLLLLHYTCADAHLRQCHHANRIIRLICIIPAILLLLLLLRLILNRYRCHEMMFLLALHPIIRTTAIIFRAIHIVA